MVGRDKVEGCERYKILGRKQEEADKDDPSVVRDRLRVSERWKVKDKHAASFCTVPLTNSFTSTPSLLLGHSS